MDEEKLIIGTIATADTEEIPEEGEGLDLPDCNDSRCISIPLGTLKKHVAILGASGSGKTVLGKAIIEEAVIQGIPVIVIDPQGDLASLAEMGNKGTVESNGTSAVSYANYLNRAEVRIFTPASSKGIPLSVNPLKIPSQELSREDRIKALDLVCSSLIRILGYKSGSPEGKAAQNFLFEFIKAAWETGLSMKDFSQMSTMVGDPRIIGMEDPSSIITDRERKKLAKNLNYLSIGMEQLMFNYGLPVDIGAFLTPYEEGKTPVNVIYLNTLTSEEHKQFFVAMIAREIYTYMLQHPSDDVQLLFLIDEVAPYLPPHPRKPPAKEMLKLLFKQGRKYGVSCIMCTQNPADVDYKAMAQASTWALGRMMAKQDLDKVRHILKTGPITRHADLLKRLPQLKPGEFILIAPDALGAPTEMKVRWLVTEHETLDEDALGEFIPQGLKGFFEEFMIASRDDTCDDDLVSGSDEGKGEPAVSRGGRSRSGDRTEECERAERMFDTPVPRGSILSLPIMIPQNEILKEANKNLKGKLFFKKEVIEDVNLRFEPLWRVGFNAKDYVGWLKIPLIGKREVQHFCVYFHGKNGKLMDIPGNLPLPMMKDDPIQFTDLNTNHPLRMDLFEDSEIRVEKTKDLTATVPRFTFSENKVRRKLETTFGKKPESVQKLLLPLWEFTIKDKEFKERRSLYLDAVHGREVRLE
jgi:hypothetical protein